VRILKRLLGFAKQALQQIWSSRHVSLPVTLKGAKAKGNSGSKLSAGLLFSSRVHWLQLRKCTNEPKQADSGAMPTIPPLN
jgi:hypothetical protein